MKPEDLQTLVSLKMPFGKYKGTLLADLPGNYLNWFAREGFPKNEIGRLLALMQEIDHNGLKPLLGPLRSTRPTTQTLQHPSPSAPHGHLDSRYRLLRIAHDQR